MGVTYYQYTDVAAYDDGPALLMVDGGNTAGGSAIIGKYVYTVVIHWDGVGVNSGNAITWKALGVNTPPTSEVEADAIIIEYLDHNDVNNWLGSSCVQLVRQ